MKHFLLLCLSLLLCTSLYADEMYLGYCDGEVTSTTSSLIGKNLTIDCAIQLPATMVGKYVGNSITRVRVGVNTKCSKLPPYVVAWVRTDKDGANLIEKQSPVVTGWNDIAFDTAIDVPEGTPLWVGYTYPQADAKISVTSFAGENVPECGYWVKKSTGSWVDQSLTANGSLCVELVVAGDNLPKHDLALMDCGALRKKVKLGTPIIVTGNIRNNAAATAQGFDIAYSVNNGAVTGVASFADQVAYRETRGFELEIPSDGLPEGVVDIELTALCGDGAADDDPSDNTGTASVALFLQGFARMVMLEEFTTEQCGWCPLGIYNINQALDNNNLRGSVVWVCHHAGYGTDFLTATESKTLTQMYGSSGSTFAPAMMVDRTYSPQYTDTSYDKDGVVGGATMDWQYTADWIESEMEDPAFVDVQITSVTIADNVVTVKVAAEKYDAFDAITTEPRINVWLKENDIKMRNQADNSGLKTGYHQHAFRASATGTWGEPIAWNGNSYVGEFTLNINSAWVQENLVVVAFVNRYSSKIRQREIYNATELSLKSPEGISSVTSDQDPVSIETYAVDGTKVSGQVSGFSIRRITEADGTVRTLKVME